VFDPKVYDNGLGIPANDGWLHRGVAYWRDGDDERIVMLTAFAEMIELDARTGNPVATFGNNGRVDLAKGLRRPVDRVLHHELVCGDRAQRHRGWGSSVMDWWGKRPLSPGDVRGFDVVTQPRRRTSPRTPPRTWAMPASLILARLCGGFALPESQDRIDQRTWTGTALGQYPMAPARPICLAGVK
jgi:hypothetical protein